MANFVQEAKVGIVKLTSTNYQLWKFGAQMLLLKEDLWGIVNGTKPEPITGEWKRRDESARATIALSIEPGLHYLIQSCDSATEMWTIIKNHFERLSYSSKIFLKKKLLGIKLESTDMSKYLSDVSNIIELLKCSGESYRDSEVISIILCGLPESYDSLIMGLEAREEQSLNLEEVKIKLLDEAERKREGIIKQQVLSTTDYTNKYRGPPIRKSINCFECGETGHIKNYCPKLRKADKINYQSNTRELNFLTDVEQVESHANQESSEYFSYVSSIDPEHTCGTRQQEWVIDSGASNNMCNQRNIMEDFMEFPEPRYVKFANGTTTTAVGQGQITITTEMDDKNKHVKIKNVILVPTMKVNLLSVPQLCNEGYKVTFKDENCCIESPEHIQLQGKIENGIFILNNQSESMESANLACLHSWHRRLGHRDINTIKAMNTNNMAKNLDIVKCSHEDFCESMGHILYYSVVLNSG